MAKRKVDSAKAVALPPVYPSVASASPKKMHSWKVVVLLLIVVAVGLLVANKGWLVAATVNGKPIYSWQLNTALRNRFGQQTLEGMIGEMLIAEQAKSKGIVVSQADLDKKQQEVLGSLGENVKLDDLLKFQGLTKADFENQLKLQLTVEQLLTKDLTISDDDVNNFIATNRAMLVATDPAKLKDEARAAIKTNIVNEKLQTWFGEIRESAKVLKFL